MGGERSGVFWGWQVILLGFLVKSGGVVGFLAVLMEGQFGRVGHAGWRDLVLRLSLWMFMLFLSGIDGVLKGIG